MPPQAERKPNQVEQKVVDPEAELSNAVRTYLKLAPQCSVEKRAGGIPQLAPQEKQLSILAHELHETLLCINLARKGQHAVRDANVKSGTRKSIVEYEQLESVLRDERAQQAELDCLNYLAQKNVIELSKKVPTEADELGMIENANNRLRRMENRLDLATKRVCVVNADNKKVREEIHRLLVERKGFNIQWNRTIGKLVKGKMYLMDIFEIASMAFSDRDECCRKLEALKWKGLFQLNRDISEMQSFEGELNHLAKLEEFLRVKGSRRICEADEKEEIKRQEEIQACEQDIARHDALLEEIFAYAGSEKVPHIINHFQISEIENFSCFILLCQVLQESIILKREQEVLRQRIFDQRDLNEAREEQQDKRIASMTKTLEELRASTMKKQELNNQADATIAKVLKGIDELVKLSKCDCNALLALLGNHTEVTKWNVSKFLRILETEVKSLIQVVYGAVKPPAPTPKGRKGPPVPPSSRLVADPRVEIIRPNRIEKLVPYQPCAYCVEDYIMNLVFETPAVPATKEYIESIFHLEDVNTKFNIYTLTIPAKRHPFRGKKD
ncbi:hypothetical protein HW555_005442 [Spodoptera exigua]|uniref:ODAD1 central coiled coil region domain-containing protein n=1 Tax=Spodoptera exigua TaxID=7107 RepID=A0A835GK29_SPOEX|nr:hypothetical protein HW555_005442 [Spodoptera exigua]